MKTNFIIFFAWLYYSYAKLKKGFQLASLSFLFLMLSFSAFSQNTYKLVWEDNFDSYDPTKKNTDILPPNPVHWTREVWPRGAFNGEQQKYTDNLRNSRIQNGLLIVEAHGDDTSSARITTQKSTVAKMQTGRIEFRAKLPAGPGTWPALWLLPTDIYKHATTCSQQTGWTNNCDAWPNSGEIDVMEHVGKDPNVIHASLHTKNASGTNPQFTAKTVVPNATTDFHLYAVEIYNDRINFFVDNQLYGSSLKPANATWENWPFDQPFFAIINLAMGGIWGGPINYNIFPVRLEVDYIKMYRIDTSVPTGDGLTANYFNGMNFETPVFSRKDATVNFNWAGGSPDPRVNADQFSASWTGQIQPRYTGAYTFYLNSDNGRKLWINNQLIIDKWRDDYGIEYSGTISLNAGQKYDIRLEYFEHVGGASCKMEWSSSLQAREVVPQSQLYSNPAPAVSIKSPTANASFVAPATISLASNATDADGVAKVDYYNGTTLIASTTSPFTYSWTPVGQGTYTIKAIATDNKGAFTISTPVTVTVGVPKSSITIQAENYNNMYGVQTAATNDGLESYVGWIDAGDWMQYYNINFPSTGSYTIEYQVASLAGGRLSSDLNGGKIQLGAVDVPPTGDWQSWKNISQTVTIGKADTYTFGIYAQSGGWNINWIKITKISSARYGSSSIEEEDVTTSGLEVYPNPAAETLSVEGDNITLVTIFDQNGLEVLASKNKNLAIGSLPAGIYTVKIVTSDGTKIRKFIKN